MQVRPDGLRTVGRTPESRPAVLSQSVWRHEEGAAVGGAFTGTVGAARPAMLAQAPAPAGTGAAATGGRPGGERAAAHPDGDEPGGHVGQGHHDQRGGPGGGAGDVVRDAEGGDGRAGWSLTVLAGSGGCDRHHRPVRRFLYRCVARLAARLLPRGVARNRRPLARACGRLTRAARSS